MASPSPAPQSWSLLTYVRMYWNQHICPPASLNETNLPNQKGKVFIVTGGNSGLGAELVRILYAAEGTVYILTRDEAKSRKVMTDMQDPSLNPTATPGAVKFIHMDLSDLASVRKAAAEVVADAPRLDVLWNNAGVGGLDPKLRTAQDIEIHHGINAVGPFLLARLLYPLMEKTAQNAAVAAVRIVWTSSVLVDIGSPTGGMDVNDLDVWEVSRLGQYASSRVGNWFLAAEFHRRNQQRQVLNITQNPGTLKTPVWRYASYYEYMPLWFLFSDPIDGARTSLWSGLQPDMSMKDGGRYVVPWGRWHPGVRPDIAMGIQSKEEGGTGAAAIFYDWCEEKAKPFVTAL